MERPEENGPETEPLQTRPIADEPKPSIFQKINNVRKAITVEPVAFLMLFASLLAGITTQTLALEKTCRVNLNLSEAICDALRNQNTDNNTENERLVQLYVANLLTWKSIITSVFPCLILTFVGGWMDLTGRRKVIMLLPVIGEVFQNLSNILNVIFFYELKVEYLIFLDASLSSIAGGWSVMFLAVFSYIADITTEKNRTHRLGLVSFCTYVGMPIGLALSGIMLKQFGYLAIYITAISLHVLNLCYITFCIRDPARTKEMKEVSWLLY